jgi:hypothetical protein
MGAVVSSMGSATERRPAPRFATAVRHSRLRSCHLCTTAIAIQVIVAAWRERIAVEMSSDCPGGSKTLDPPRAEGLKTYFVRISRYLPRVASAAAIPVW